MQRLQQALSTDSQGQTVLCWGLCTSFCDRLQHHWQQGLQPDAGVVPIKRIALSATQFNLKLARPRKGYRPSWAKSYHLRKPQVDRQKAKSLELSLSQKPLKQRVMMPSPGLAPATTAALGDSAHPSVLARWQDANLLVLSSTLQVWLQFRILPAAAPRQQVAVLFDYPLEAEKIQVTVTFDQSALAELQKLSAIATELSGSADYCPTAIKAGGLAQRLFWNSLVQLSGSQPKQVQPSALTAFEYQPSMTQLLSELAPIGIIQFGLDGGINQANPAFCQLLGYTSDQLQHLDNRTISYPEDFAVELRLIQALVAEKRTQQVFTKRFIHHAGQIVWTETRLHLVGDLDSGKATILCFVSDISDQRSAELEIQQRRERETLLNEIAAQLRTATSLQAILQVTVDRLLQALQADRVIIYQFLADFSGVCLAEALNPVYPSMLGQRFAAECIPPPHLEPYRMGRFWSVKDVQAANLADCHLDMLEQVFVQGMMATAIVSLDEALQPQNRTLWGLLVVHSCRAPRDWTQDEQQLVQAVAHQVATALEQTKLLYHLQGYTQELEDRVSQRTQSLERALKFEQLIRGLTEVLRTDLEGSQLLTAATSGLVQTIGALGCVVSLFDAEQTSLQVSHAYFPEQNQVLRSLVGQTISLEQWSGDCRLHLLERQTFVCCNSSCQICHLMDTVVPSAIHPLPGTEIARLVSPIVDDQGLIGLLILLYESVRGLQPDEIKLVEQITAQCAIALRQAHLYQQEHEQRLSADYFRTFLKKSIDVFVEYDADLRYLSINPTGGELLGLPLSEIIGKTNGELLGAAAEPTEAIVRQVFETGEEVYVDHEFNLPQGKKVFETIYAPITNPAGKVQRVIGICRDITELKQQWQLLEIQNHQLAETIRLKQEFIATTSHELRTPLTAILGFSNVLLQEFFGELNLKQKDYVDRIHGSGQHLLDLINDILDLSRLEADRLELDLQTIFIPDICEGVISLVQERALGQGLDLHLELDPGVDWMVVDPRRLKQMLLNLLTNAVKFTQQGEIGLKVWQSGLITKLAATGADRSQRSELIPDTIHFLVWDTGIGISDADQRRLFAPFSQIDSSLSRKHQGTGLGLVITRKLAELHGGSVSLDSAPGEGARFTISLPLQKIG